MVLRFVVMRHGQSQWNLEQRFAGRTDVALTPQGIEEARAAGRILEREGLAFDRVYTSDLQRARHTAAEALAQLSVNGARVESTWRLNERNFGDLEGVPFVEARARFGEDWWQRLGWDLDLAVPGGESLGEVANRLRPWLWEEAVPALRAGERVLAVAHGNTIRALDEVLRQGAGERVPMVPTATPILYDLDPASLTLVERRLLPRDS